MPEIFKAKKTIIQQDIDVISGRPVITPPREHTETVDGKEVTITIPATVDYQIRDVKPEKYTDTEWTQQKALFVKIAKRINNLKNII